ncbi:MAG: organic solvent transporter substrate-binding protein [Solirubrobacterales bacterium]|nr:organic solvent transporter substrate-binding protein [Solirubrobacterales bacterium]
MPPRLRALVGPAAVVAITVLAIVGGNRLLFPPGGGYVVTAEFQDAAGLTKNSDVKIGGVAGGSVTDLKLTDRDTALVTMELDKGAFPIGAGAKAASRPVNLLGEKYIDMDPGDLSKPLRSGSTIPMSRTSRPVELDDVLNTLQPDVRARLRILINEAGIALTGRGTDLNKTIDQLPSALDQTTKLVDSFSADNQRLGNLIERSDKVLATLASKGGDLQDLVTSAASTLNVTASKRVELANTVRAAPGALRQLRGTMTQLADTSERLEPFAAQVRKTAPPLTQALKELPSFAQDATPALAAVRAASPSLTRLGVEARSPVQRLKPTSIRLASFAKDFKPLVDSFDKQALKNMLGLMNGWSRTIAKSDGLGHLFGLRILFDKTLVTSVIDRYVGPSLPATKAKTTPAKAPSNPVKDLLPNLTKPKLPTVKVPAVPKTGIAAVDKALEDVGGAVNGLLPGLTGALGRTADGLTGKGTSRAAQPTSAGSDVGALFDYLVGP